MSVAALNVRHAAQKQIDDVLIVQRIEDLPAFFAGAHDTQLAQAAHMMRHGRFADAGGLGQRADVRLTADERVPST